MTEYVVLRLEKEANENVVALWGERGRVRARSAKSAIQQHVGQEPQLDGIFTAVPARSWKPMTVTLEQKTEIKFE